MSSKQSSPIVMLAGAGIIIIGLFYAGQSLQRVDAMIADLPVQGKAAPKAETSNSAPPAVADKARTLHPLLIESSRKAAAVQGAAPDSAKLDGLFERKDPVDEKKKEQEKVKEATPPPPPPTDYFKFLPQVLKVQAVTSEGAVINGKFYALGEDIPDYAYPKLGTSQMINPVLSDTEREAAIIKEPSTGRTFRVALH